jgi:nucleotidyltransferase substrate binding protein (TIGR01987 family)
MFKGDCFNLIGMKIETEFLEKCNLTLAKAFELLQKEENGTINYELYRSAAVKEFEIILEQTGKLLKKCLKPYFSSSAEVDRLFFKDIFRHAAKFGLINIEASERWMDYRDCRNATAHDYGVGFASDTLKLLPEFIEDTNYIIKIIQKENDTQR